MRKEEETNKKCARTVLFTAAPERRQWQNRSWTFQTHAAATGSVFRGYHTAIFISAPISSPERRQLAETKSRAGWCRLRAWYRCRYENSRVATSLPLSYDRTRLNW